MAFDLERSKGGSVLRMILWRWANDSGDIIKDHQWKQVNADVTIDDLFEILSVYF